MGRLCGTQTPLKKPMFEPLHQQRIPPGGVRARHRARAGVLPAGDHQRVGPRRGALAPRHTARVQAAGVFSINSNRVSLVKPCSSTQRACHSSANNLSSDHIPRHPSLRNQKHTHTPFSASPVLRPRQPPMASPASIPTGRPHGHAHSCSLLGSEGLGPASLSCLLSWIPSREGISFYRNKSFFHK